MNVSSAKREVIYSLLYRIGGMGLGFIATGLLVRELGAEKYGVWAALTSLLAWIQLSDFGVGYALKNRIASTSAPDGMLKLVSGVFQFYVLVATFLVGIFLLFGNLLSIVRDYRLESFLLYIGTIVFFPLTIGSAILQGMRKNSLSSLISFLQSTFWILSVLLLVRTNISLLLLSLINISIVLLMGVGQYALGVRILVGNVRTAIAQLFNFRNIQLALPLWGVGIRFILLQSSSVILFSLGTYLTYSNLSSAEAAKYDILFKLFQVPLTFFNVVISVYWVEVAKSVSLNDRKSLEKRYWQLQLMALCVSLIMLLFSLFIASPLIKIYTGGKINASVSDALAFCFLIIIQIHAYAGAVFLNAAENLRGQIIFAVIAAILLIPVVLFFYSCGIGFSAIPLATAVLIIPSLFYCNYSAYYHVIKKFS